MRGAVMENERDIIRDVILNKEGHCVGKMHTVIGKGEWHGYMRDFIIDAFGVKLLNSYTLVNIFPTRKLCDLGVQFAFKSLTERVLESSKNWVS